MSKPEDQRRVAEARERLTCGVCGLPIHPSEGGLRHFGFYTAHADYRCIELLKADRDRMRMALERIERWHGEFPETGRTWNDEAGTPMSYGACYGSNGERDFMRGIARAALIEGKQHG